MFLSATVLKFHFSLVSNMQLYARRHFLYPPLSINEYNERVMKVVRCEAQVCA